MIEIITTRFHEAYTWILPTEHGRQQNYMKEQRSASIKRFNDAPRRSYTLLDGEKGIHVIDFEFAMFSFVA
jgi:hypothetical protein